MRIRIVTLALTLTFALTFAAGAALAGQKAGAFTLAPMIGGAMFEGDMNLEDGTVPGAALGYNVSEEFAWELSLFGVNTDADDTGGNVDVTALRLDGIFNLADGGDLVPYFALGAGGIETNRDDRGTDRSWLVDYGMGLKYYIAENVALRGDLRHLAIFEEKTLDHALLYTAGLHFQFAEAAKVAPRDSDGDGVTDDRDKCPGTPKGVMVDEDGCPLTFTLQIEFDLDKADIRPVYHTMLSEAAEFIARYPAPKILIAGHTDDQGEEAYNLDLSKRRAASVRQYLIDNFGIEANKLVARGYGESRPVAENATAEGRQQNRRVEITCCAVLPE